MNRLGVLNPFFVGVIGAAVGASAVLGLNSTQHNATVMPAAADAGSEDDQQRIEEAVKHVEPSVVALDVSINGHASCRPIRLPAFSARVSTADLG